MAPRRRKTNLRLVSWDFIPHQSPRRRKTNLRLLSWDFVPHPTAGLQVSYSLNQLRVFTY
jgi:hypothetical protein